MECLVPVPDIQGKLDADLVKAKEKAEKAAKSLVQTSARKANAQVSKESKKRKKAVDNSDPVAMAQLEANLAREALEKDHLAQQQDEHVRAAVSKALALCKTPSSVGLTVLSKTSGADLGDKTARAEAMAAALREAEKKVAAASASNQGGSSLATSTKEGKDHIVVGLQAAMSVLRRQGSLAPTALKKGKAKKDDKSLAEGDLKKLGKHLLK